MCMDKKQIQLSAINYNILTILASNLSILFIAMINGTEMTNIFKYSKINKTFILQYITGDFSVKNKTIVF